jgi:hypothetical protein
MFRRLLSVLTDQPVVSGQFIKRSFSGFFSSSCINNICQIIHQIFWRNPPIGRWRIDFGVTMKYITKFSTLNEFFEFSQYHQYKDFRPYQNLVNKWWSHNYTYKIFRKYDYELLLNDIPLDEQPYSSPSFMGERLIKLLAFSFVVHMWEFLIFKEYFYMEYFNFIYFFLKKIKMIPIFLYCGYPPTPHVKH